MGHALTLDEIADELYALPAGDFVAARTRHEKQARADGDKALAAAVKSLRKPTAVAWLANQLVRAHREELRPLLELGADLRAATAALKGPELRALSSQQNRVIAALVGQARALAGQAGHPATDATLRGIDDTLRAALASEAAAEALLAARLADGLAHVGFGVGGPAAAPTPVARPSGQERAEEALARAVSAAGAAAEKVARLEGEDRELGSREEQLRSEVARLTEDLARVTRDRTAAGERLDAARLDRDEAEDGVARARAALDALRP